MSSKSNKKNPFGPPPSIFDDTTSTPPPLPFNTTDHLFNQNSHPLASILPNLDNHDQSPSSRSGSIYSPSPKMTTPILPQLHSPKENPNGNLNTNPNLITNPNTNPSSIPTITDNHSSENTSPVSKDNDTNDTNDTEEDWGAPPTSEQEPMLPNTTIPTSTPTPTPNEVRVSRFAKHSKVPRSRPILSHSISNANRNREHDRAPYPHRRQYPLQHGHGSTSNVRPDGNTIAYSNSNMYISPNPSNDIVMHAEDFGAPPPNATEPLLLPPAPNSSTTISNALYTSNCYTAFNRNGNGYGRNHGEYGFGVGVGSGPGPYSMAKRYEYNLREHSEYSGDRKRKRSPSSCYLRYDIDYGIKSQFTNKFFL